VFFDSGASISINHYCTTASVKNSSLMPTIWFEADGAHGVADFIGMQTLLAELHGRNSCSYDPPNFGWSSRLPSSESTDLTVVFNSLVHAIQRENETKVLAGWGAGGENVLRHASQNPETVKGVVWLDVSPNGIEWLDAKRARNLTMEDTMTLAKDDLRGRISLMQTILAVGVPW
jgi:pimeloyl-ACP methyl ester carboxylesterase